MQNKNKVYGLLLEINELFFLSIQYADSLELAVEQAKREFIKVNPQIMNTKLSGIQINLFTIKDVGQLVNENKNYKNRKIEKQLTPQKEQIKQELPQKVEIKKVEFTQQEVKNIIMDEIINNKNKDVFKKHKELFNENETKYLKDELKKKDTKKDLTSKNQ